MAGIADRGDRKAVEAFYKSVAWAAEFLAPHGLDVVIEPINPRNVPGYFLNDFNFARDLIDELKIPNLKLQFDIYHCQIIHGDVTMRLREMMPIVGHVQIASVPSRNEPDGTEKPWIEAEPCGVALTISRDRCADGTRRVLFGLLDLQFLSAGNIEPVMDAPLRANSRLRRWSRDAAFPEPAAGRSVGDSVRRRPR